MTNILLAIDGLLYGKAIENFVVNHRWLQGTSFKLIHAIEDADLLLHLSGPLQGLDAWPVLRMDPEQFNKEKMFLVETAARIEMALPDVIISCEIRQGNPKEEIIAEAIRWPAEMIVMGSHGRHGLQRFLMGSVSLSVTTQAPCSVVIMRLPKITQ